MSTTMKEKTPAQAKAIEMQRARSKRECAVKLLRKGKDLAEVMAKTGLSLGFVRGLQAAITRPPAKPHAARAKQRMEVVRRLREGEDPNDVARTVDLTVNYVRQIGLQNGISMPMKTPNKDVFAAIKRLMETDDTCTQIARDMQVTEGWMQFVYARCVETGIPVRKRDRGNSAARSQTEKE